MSLESEPIHVVAAVNDSDVFERNLMRSPAIHRGALRVFPQAHFSSAGVAYNTGLAESTSRYVAFVHQDVYLPAGWERRLRSAISLLNKRSTRWGVLGVWGIRDDYRLIGRVWCSGGGLEHVGLVPQPTPAVSVDEIVIVVDRDAGLYFDTDLPGFHLYGTDIILEARQRALGAFVVDAPVVHNSRPNPQVFDSAFFSAYRYMQRKWATQLPLATCTVPITRSAWPLYMAWLRRERHKRFGTYMGGQRVSDPSQIAVRLGYEDSRLAWSDADNNSELTA